MVLEHVISVPKVDFQETMNEKYYSDNLKR
jgi:hypothetical protein